MPVDKFQALWLSHSSIGDYLKCPRLYFLKNIYKDPKTGHKVSLMTPPLALGQVVHEVIESLSVLPSHDRFRSPLTIKFGEVWEKVTGERGGFKTPEIEKKFKKRGIAMIERIMNNPDPLKKKAVKLKEELPWFWLSEPDEIILCGKIDWLIYNESDDSVHILDFKTGLSDELESSLQLPIYALIAKNCQTRKTSGAAYWYLDRENAPKEVSLPDVTEAQEKLLAIGKKIKLARTLKRLECKQNGCKWCIPMERVYRGEGKFVGLSNYNQDIYIEK